MNKKTSLRIFKIFSAFFIFISCSVTVSAQVNIHPLEGPALDNILKSNKQKGLSMYQGINTQFNVTINCTKVSAPDSAKVVSDIKNLPGVIGCTFTPSSYSLIVNSPKENKLMNIVEIKKVLIENNLHIINYQETIYKN